MLFKMIDVLIDNGGLTTDCSIEDVFGSDYIFEDQPTECDPEDVLYGIDFKDTTETNKGDVSYDCSPEDIYGANYVPEDITLNTTTFDVVI